MIQQTNYWSLPQINEEKKKRSTEELAHKCSQQLRGYQPDVRAAEEGPACGGVSTQGHSSQWEKGPRRRSVHLYGWDSETWGWEELRCSHTHAHDHLECTNISTLGERKRKLMSPVVVRGQGWLGKGGCKRSGGNYLGQCKYSKSWLGWW